jgi:energy-coupling factor transport system permease protein
MTNSRDSRWRTLHPVMVFILLLIHGVVVFLWENPLLIAGQLLFLGMWAFRERLFQQLPSYFRYGWWIAMVFLVINPLFSSNGVTFLWKGPVIPVIGRLDVTVEELGYAGISLFRLAILIILSGMFQRFVDHDRLMLSFSKIMPRFVLTAVLAIRLFPFLEQELTRIGEIMKLRGIVPKSSTWRDMLVHRMFFLRPLLLSAMEGSWMTAETLYVRGFGSGPRSVYKPSKMTSRELVGFLLILVIPVFALFGIFQDFGRFQFYPQVAWHDPLGDLLFLGGMLAVWVFPLVWLARRQED